MHLWFYGTTVKDFIFSASSPWGHTHMEIKINWHWSGMQRNLQKTHTSLPSLACNRNRSFVSVAVAVAVFLLPVCHHAVLFATKNPIPSPIPNPQSLSLKTLCSPCVLVYILSCPIQPMDLLDVFIAANNVSGFPGTPGFGLVCPDSGVYLLEPLMRIIRQNAARNSLNE